MVLFCRHLAVSHSSTAAAAGSCPALPFPAATVDDSLPFILNILLANCASLAGVGVVLCLTQVGHTRWQLPRMRNAMIVHMQPSLQFICVSTPCPHTHATQPAVQPLVLALLPPLGLAYRQLQRYYRSTSRELRRLDAVAKSPVYTAFTEALSGGPTIRAFAAQPHFLSEAEAAVEAQQRAAVASAAASSWLGLRLQLMAASLAAAVAAAAVAEHAGTLPWSSAGPGGGSSRGMSAGLVGLSLSYVLPITGLLNGLLTSSAETGVVQQQGLLLGHLSSSNT